MIGLAGSQRRIRRLLLQARVAVRGASVLPAPFLIPVSPVHRILVNVLPLIWSDALSQGLEDEKYRLNSRPCRTSSHCASL